MISFAFLLLLAACSTDGPSSSIEDAVVDVEVYRGTCAGSSVTIDLDADTPTIASVRLCPTEPNTLCDETPLRSSSGGGDRWFDCPSGYDYEATVLIAL